jgi:hypothetical protein
MNSFLFTNSRDQDQERIQKLSEKGHEECKTKGRQWESATYCKRCEDFIEEYCQAQRPFVTLIQFLLYLLV